jgi:hypothetical protein
MQPQDAAAGRWAHRPWFRLSNALYEEERYFCAGMDTMSALTKRFTLATLAALIMASSPGAASAQTLNPGRNDGFVRQNDLQILQNRFQRQQYQQQQQQNRAQDRQLVPQPRPVVPKLEPSCQTQIIGNVAVSNCR